MRPLVLATLLTAACAATETAAPDPPAAELARGATWSEPYAFLGRFDLFGAGEAERWAALPYTRISMWRSGCFGTCPIYRVDFVAAGTTTYVGQGFVEHQGTLAGATDLRLFARLAAAADVTDFFALQDFYDVPVTDLPSITIEIETPTGVKRVEDYGGTAPPAFYLMRALIDDELAQLLKWEQLAPVESAAGE